jgi:hypothetical protein
MKRNLRRSVLLSVLIGFTLCACTRYDSESRAQPPASSVKKDLSVFDGTYEFVSEVTDVIAPEKRRDERAALEWEGLWLFQNGYFSQTLAKRQRLDWTPSHFPDDARKLGFDSASGKYKLEGNTVQLDYVLTFYPGKAGKREILSYRFDGNQLTLTEELAPTREYAATGQRVLVLRKVN